MSCAKALRIPASQGFGQLYPRLAAGFVKRLHAGPGHGTAHAQAYGFGEGFLGGKSGGQEAQAAGWVAPVAQQEFFKLLRAQYAPGETVTVAGIYLPDAVNTQ